MISSGSATLRSIVRHGKASRLEHVAVGPAPARLLGRHAVDGDRPAGWLLEISDDAQERRLAAARRPDEGNEFALADRQVDVRQRMHRPVIGVEGE